jgi:hypothetical protein
VGTVPRAHPPARSLRALADDRATSQFDERRAMQTEVGRLKKLYTESEAVRSPAGAREGGGAEGG